MDRAGRLTLFICLMMANVVGGIEQSPAPTFSARYQEFNQIRLQRLQQIQNQAELESYLSWQRAQIEMLLKSSPAEGERLPEELTPLGNLYQLNGEHAKAIILYRESLAARPDDQEALTGLIVSLMETNQVQEADRLFTQHQAAIPRDRFFQIGLRLAQALSENGEYEKSATYLNAILESAPSDDVKSLLFEVMADNFAASGQKDKAVALLQSRLQQCSGRQPITRNLQAKLQQITLLQEVAPDIEFEKWIGPPCPRETWKGKVVLLDFWAPWCAPCRAGMARLKDYHDRYHSQGLEIVGITTYYGNFSDGSRQVPNVPRTREFALIGEFWQACALPWGTGITASNAAHNSYHVNGIPQTVLIDRNGVIRYIEVGFNPYSSRLEQRIRSLLKN